ncbi:DUF1697 domain-containing protein [Lascolabacillus massiliensis]|jgi:uncharacterized protein (DUF1697 family)|uniref:DUF1697 domain-containing protein n=1 Tax=Lascolabacillus massiliensis TaxID=1627894 RepID=UPI000B26FCE3|nr:DUF1697 domain-containing protein [Lascolabacillus massiliensis]
MLYCFNSEIKVQFIKSMIYIALFRGINVGGNNKVDMKKLKSLLERTGFENVVTYINSGNVIFKKSGGGSEAELARIIEQAVKDEFQLDLKIVVINSNHLDAICREIPADWVKNDEMRTDVLFLWEKYDYPGVLDIIKYKEVDNVKYVPGALVWNVREKDYTKSNMVKLVGTDLYRHITIRNVNTVRKLHEMVNNLE